MPGEEGRFPTGGRLNAGCDIREIGYPSVQASGIGPIEPKELKRIADDLGLRICAAHASYADLTGNLSGVIGKLKTWGGCRLAISSSPPEFHHRDGYVRFAEEMTRIGEEPAQAGITFSYHNHAFEFERYCGKLGLELIHERSDPKCLQAEIDTYWIQYGGGNPVA